MYFVNILIGFLILFSVYQVAEANGQGILRFPGKPYSILILFLLVIPAAEMVARWQGDPGLSSYGMGLQAGWWQKYLFGFGLGMTMEAILEFIGIKLGVRSVFNLRFSWHSVLGGILWGLTTNFPAAAGEDLVTRGYLWRFMKFSPLLLFVAISTLIYTLNHIIRLLTRPVTDWYHLPFLGITLAYALYQTGSLWFIIGLHQSGNVILPLMRQTMDVHNTTNNKKRIVFGILSQIVMLIMLVLIIQLISSSIA